MLLSDGFRVQVAFRSLWPTGVYKCFKGFDQLADLLAGFRNQRLFQYFLTKKRKGRKRINKKHSAKRIKMGQWLIFNEAPQRPLRKVHIL